MGFWRNLFGRKQPAGTEDLARPSVESRRKAAWDLGSRGDPSALPTLLQYLDDESLEVRRAAASSIEQLWWTGDLLAIDKLSSILKNKAEDSEVRRTVALALAEYVPKLAETLSGDLPSAKEARQNALDALIESLKDAEQEVVKYAVTALANFEDRKTVRPMVEALKSRSIEILESAIETIGSLRPTRVRRAMKKALEDFENSPEIVPRLIEDLKSQQRSVRLTAEAALGKLDNRQAIEALRPALNDNDENVKRVARKTLARLRDIEVLPLIVEDLNNKDYNKRVSAVVDLEALSDPRTIERTIELLKLALYNDGAPDIRLPAIRGLAKLNDPRTIEALRLALKDSHWHIRLAAVQALSDLNDPRTIEALQLARKDSDSLVRSTAEQALAKLRNA